MPKLDLRNAIRIKGAGGEINALKGQGFSWTKPNVDPILAYFQSTGANGAYYTPWDKSTLFQDAAGTIPVVNNGDPVGLMLDASGNAHHLSETISSRRPQYKTDGTYHWLDFDGVGDRLSTLLDFSQADVITLSAAFTRGSQTDLRHLLEFTSNSFNTEGAFLIRSSLDSANAGCRQRRAFSAITHTFAYPQNKTGIITLTNKTKTSMTSRVDGIDVETTTVGVSFFANDTLYIGGRTSVGYDFAGQMYGIVLTDTSVTDSILLAMEQFLAAKSGVTL